METHSPKSRARWRLLPTIRTVASSPGMSPGTRISISSSRATPSPSSPSSQIVTVRVLPTGFGELGRREEVTEPGLSQGPVESEPRSGLSQEPNERPAQRGDHPFAGCAARRDMALVVLDDGASRGIPVRKHGLLAFVQQIGRATEHVD